jgi:hypothetical protein
MSIPAVLAAVVVAVILALAANGLLVFIARIGVGQ